MEGFRANSGVRGLKVDSEVGFGINGEADFGDGIRAVFAF